MIGNYWWSFNCLPQHALFWSWEPLHSLHTWNNFHQNIFLSTHCTCLYVPLASSWRSMRVTSCLLDLFLCKIFCINIISVSRHQLTSTLIPFWGNIWCSGLSLGTYLKNSCSFLYHFTLYSLSPSMWNLW